MFDNIPNAFWKIAIPLIIIMVGDQLFATIDFWFISQLSDSVNSRSDYITAIGIVFPVFFIIIAFSGGLSTAMNNIGSLYLGKGDNDSKNIFIGVSLLFAAIISFFLIIFSTPIINYSLSFFSISEGVFNLAASYLHIIFYGSFFLFTFNIFTQILSLYQDYKVQIGLALISLIAAIFADWIFVFQLGMGIQGGALSTILIFFLSSMFLIIYSSKKKYIELNFNYKDIFISNRIHEYKKFFLPAFISQAFIMVEFFITNKIISKFGEDVIAGYAIGVKLQSVIIMLFIAFGVTLMIMYGIFLGQKNILQIKKVERYYIKVSLITSMVIGFLIFMFQDIFPTFFSNNLDIINTGKLYILMLIAFFAIFPMLFMQIAIFQITGSSFTRIAQTVTILVTITLLQYIGSQYSVGLTFWLYLLGQLIGLIVFSYFAIKIRKEKILSV